MHKRLIGAVVAVTAPMLALGTAAAAGHSGSKNSKDHITKVVVHVDHKKCGITTINGITNHGLVAGTSYCGHSAAFTETKGGKVTVHRLPKKDARYTSAANISSNGILALSGSKTKNGKLTGYLLYKNGKLVHIADPKAGKFDTIVNSVNRHGAAVGVYCVARSCNERRPFIYRHGTYKDFTLDRHGARFPSLTMITDSGQLAGYFFKRPGYARAFIKKGHKIRVYDAPHAGKKRGQGTFLVGTPSSRASAMCGVVISPHHHARGFVVVHGREHVIDVHPSKRKAYTEVLACNRHGEFGGSSPSLKKHYNEGFLGKIG